jgi:hypothetical protein
VNQHDGAMRRLFAALDHRAGAGAEGERLLPRAAQLDDIESGGREAAARFLRR